MPEPLRVSVYVPAGQLPFQMTTAPFEPDGTGLFAGLLPL